MALWNPLGQPLDVFNAQWSVILAQNNTSNRHSKREGEKRESERGKERKECKREGEKRESERGKERKERVKERRREKSE